MISYSLPLQQYFIFYYPSRGRTVVSIKIYYQALHRDTWRWHNGWKHQTPGRMNYLFSFHKVDTVWITEEEHYFFQMHIPWGLDNFKRCLNMPSSHLEMHFYEILWLSRRLFLFVIGEKKVWNTLVFKSRASPQITLIIKMQHWLFQWNLVVWLSEPL